MLQNVPMKFRRVSFARRALAGAALALSTFAAAQTSPFQFNLPPDYLNRFGGAEPVVSSTDGYGVRGLPLPTPLDLRVSLVKAPTYWDGGLSLRASDTTFRVGRFYNVPTLEITHDPYKGAQFSGVVRGEGGLSVFSGGYASTSWQDRVRVLNNVGVAFKGEVTAPYTRSEVSVGYGQPFGAFNTYVAATARAYTFPLQREVQGSVDFYASASVSPCSTTRAPQPSVRTTLVAGVKRGMERAVEGVDAQGQPAGGDESEHREQDCPVEAGTLPRQHEQTGGQQRDGGEEGQQLAQRDGAHRRTSGPWPA